MARSYEQNPRSYMVINLLEMTLRRRREDFLILYPQNQWIFLSILLLYEIIVGYYINLRVDKFE